MYIKLKRAEKNVSDVLTPVRAVHVIVVVRKMIK